MKGPIMSEQESGICRHAVLASFSIYRPGSQPRDLFTLRNVIKRIPSEVCPEGHLAGDAGFNQLITNINRVKITCCVVKNTSY